MIAGLKPDCRAFNMSPSAKRSTAHSGRWKISLSSGSKSTMVLLFLSMVSSIVVGPYPLIALLLVLLMARLFSALQFSRRRTRFEKDLPAFFVSLASVVRSGCDPFTALYLTRELFPEDGQITIELKKVLESIDDGCQETEALKGFGQDFHLPEIDLFHCAFLFSHKEGAALSSSLMRLSRIVRQRFSFRRKIAAALAAQKISAVGIVLCSIAIITFQLTTSFDATYRAFHTEVGFYLYVTSSILIALGICIITLLSISRY